jgi:class 3 adenylate cyclase/pimeloyl-ACP methyl ester carboxylesterase
MTEPQIRYCTTEDGVRIAYTMTGKGPVLVWAPDLPNSHVRLEWQQPGIREQLEAFASAFTVVRFDARGVGLSDRDVSDFSFAARSRDLEAVVTAVRAGERGRLVLMGVEWSGPLVIAYAVRHPEIVSHLVLMDTFARSADFAEHPRSRLAMELLDRDWEMFVDTRISLAIGLGKQEAGVYVDFYRQCVTQDVAQAMFPQLARDDVRDLLPRVAVPTLVLQHTGLRARTDDMSRTLASHIGGAQLVVLDGGYFDTSPTGSVVRFVLGHDVAPSASGTAIILFADIVDSTATQARTGNEAFRERSRRLEDALRGAISEAGGTPVEGRTLGDGVLGDFRSAAQAIVAALACAVAATECGLALHLGIHAGDVIREARNVYGVAVSVASRISALSGPNEILVSSTVRDLARGSSDVTFEDRGEHALKGVGEPQRVFAVRRQDG